MSKISYIRESLVQSVLADIFTFGAMVGSFYFNEKFIGSGFMNGVILIMFIMFLINKANKNLKTFKTNEELIKFLSDEVQL